MGGHGREPIRSEHSNDVNQVLLEGAIHGIIQPVFPIDARGVWQPERLPPGLQVELDAGEASAVVHFNEVVSGEMGGRGRVRIVLSAFDEAGLHGILLHIEERRAVVRGTERKREIVVLPKMAIGLAEVKNLAGVLRLQVAHEMRNAVTPGLVQDEVHVIGHEAEGMEADVMPAGEAVETVEVGEKLGGVLEDTLAFVTTLVHVIGLEALEVTTGASHAN